MEQAKQILAAQEDKRIYEQFWKSVEQSLEKRLENEDFGKVRIYQDHETECGAKSVEWYKKRAEEKGQWNAKILVKLVNKGATLMKTEDEEVLMEGDDFRDYTRGKLRNEKNGLLKKVIDKETQRTISNFIISLASVVTLNKRDAHISKNIFQSLKEGETGILFIGAGHHVEELLPKDIEIEDLAEKDTLVKGALKKTEKFVAKARKGK